MRRNIVLVVALALSLGGCETLARFDKSVFSGGLSITATVQNPVTREQQAAIEVSYNIAARAVLTYGRLRRCGPNETAGATNVCAYPGAVAQLKRANRVAYTALVNLRRFMDANQQVSAISAYNAAATALREFRAVASINNLKIADGTP